MSKPRNEWGDALLVQAIYEHLGGALYHVGDEANAESIDRHGLLSNAEAARLDIIPKMRGGNRLTQYLDERDGLNDHVFLSFFKSVLMPKDDRVDRLRRPIILEIAPEVLFLKGVEIRLGRGAYADRVRAMQAFYKMDWEIWNWPERRDDLIGGKARWNTFLNYEVLVPECVPRNYILGIAERSVEK